VSGFYEFLFKTQPFKVIKTVQEKVIKGQNKHNIPTHKFFIDLIKVRQLMDLLIVYIYILGAAWSSGLRHQSVLTLPGRSWVQISAPPMCFPLDKTNNGAANNKRASNNNRAAEARSRRLKRKADD
jgi:hypothetical protein